MDESSEPIAAGKPDELIVDLEHKDLVAAELEDGLGVEFTVAATDDLLGLALFTGLNNPAGTIDNVLDELRRRFSGKFGGWVPEFGKHRLVGVIAPLGPKPMQIGPPLAVEKPDGPFSPLGPSAGQGVSIGMIDTKIRQIELLDETHIEFDVNAEGDSGHGVFVASILQQYAPEATIKARGALGGADRSATAWAVAKEIVRLAREVDILNLSFGCYTGDGEPPLVIRRAIERVPSDVVIVAAAGNHGGLTTFHRGFTAKAPAWPAALPNVVAVGAMDNAGEPSEFNPNLPWVNLLAPGEDVGAAYPVDQDHPTGWAQWSGTSFGAAAVSGLIAAEMTTPAGGSARDALERLRGGASQVVKKFVWRDDSDHA